MTLFHFMVRTHPKYWNFGIGFMIGGIAQPPRLDLNIGPFEFSVYFGKTFE